mmetsp:Transcript_18945/g.32385  ORF Transcript_18945/g.32385 Transcript_18945/m.32385 type:complete len:201 (-) Transcript_18945:1034-1636(-)
MCACASLAVGGRSQSMRRSMSLAYRLIALLHPSTTTKQNSGVTSTTPVMWFSLALTSTLYLLSRVSSLCTLYTLVMTSVPVSSNSLRSFLSLRSAGVSARDMFLSSCAACRSAICLRVSISSMVGSATACSPNTRYKLDSLTLGFAGSSSPCLIRSCFSFSLACRLCVRSFFISLVVNLSGWGGGWAASAGGWIGTGCST